MKALPIRSEAWKKQQARFAIAHTAPALVAKERAVLYLEDFYYAGQKCRIRKDDRRGDTFRGGCGYVISPWPEPFDCYFDALDVHGGLTGRNGFDTSHRDDMLISFKSKAWVKMETQFLALQIASQCANTVGSIVFLQSLCRTWLLRRRWLLWRFLFQNPHWPRELVWLTISYL